MADDKPIDADDAALFRDAVKGVQPLKQTATAARKPPPRPNPTHSRRDNDDVIAEMANGTGHYDDVEYGDDVYFHRPHVSKGLLKKLRRGQIAVQAELDLHGMKLADAKSELSRFIQYARDRGLGCVSVVHGKGHRSPDRSPVLKPEVARWLAQWDGVDAFTSARESDGGTGALYVLLRSR